MQIDYQLTPEQQLIADMLTTVNFYGSITFKDRNDKTNYVTLTYQPKGKINITVGGILKGGPKANTVTDKAGQ